MLFDELRVYPMLVNLGLQQLRCRYVVEAEISAQALALRVLARSWSAHHHDDLGTTGLPNYRNIFAV